MTNERGRAMTSRGMRAIRLGWLAILIGTLPFMAGCASSSTPAVAEVTVAIAMDANPDLSGRPSPVTVRVYELTGPYALMQADFMQIFSKDAGTLGPDLRSKSEFTLAPGQRQTLRIELKPDSHGIAVVALFRDYINANWRAYAALPGAGTTGVTADIGARQVAITAGGQ